MNKKIIFVGNDARNRYHESITKSLRWIHVSLAAVVVISLLVPLIWGSRIFNKAQDISNVALISTYSGSGSGVYIGNGMLLTAAHVVDGMSINDVVDVSFFDPNQSNRAIIESEAILICSGNWKDEVYSEEEWVANLSQDFALLQLANRQIDHLLKPCVLSNSDNVKVQDKITAVGFPNGVYSSTDGTINNITGGISRNNDIIIVNAGAWPGNSGGALLDAKGTLIGLVNNTGNKTSQEASGQTLALKINRIRMELNSKGYLIQ